MQYTRHLLAVCMTNPVVTAADLRLWELKNFGSIPESLASYFQGTFLTEKSNHSKNSTSDLSSHVPKMEKRLGLQGNLSAMAQQVKNLPAMQETQETLVRFLSREDPLEKEMATHSSILACEIPWTEEPGGLQSMGSQRVGHD